MLPWRTCDDAGEPCNNAQRNSEKIKNVDLTETKEACWLEQVHVEFSDPVEKLQINLGSRRRDYGVEN